MKKIEKPKKVLKRRHIEDVPFYKFSYGSDDLPLDPAKPFILEKISKSFRKLCARNVCYLIYRLYFFFSILF